MLTLWQKYKIAVKLSVSDQTKIYVLGYEFAEDYKNKIT